MQIRFFSSLQEYSVLTVKYASFLFNLSLLAGLGIKTVNLWIAAPFDFSDTLNAVPNEPEWLNRHSAESQFWTATIIETLLFLIGGFLCYEILIKQKTFRRTLVAPIAIAFLFAAGESIPLFLPATEKAHQIGVCKASGISWDTVNHKCRLMDLELKRFEQLKLHKKQKMTTLKTSVRTENGSATSAVDRNAPAVPATSPLPENDSGAASKPKKKRPKHL